MKVRLRELTDDDLPLIERWLRADHVRSAWGDPDANSQLMREPPAAGHWRAIIEAGDRKVGLVLWQHPTRQELDEAGLNDIPETVIDIDIMIGEHDAIGLPRLLPLQQPGMNEIVCRDLQVYPRLQRPEGLHLRRMKRQRAHQHTETGFDAFSEATQALVPTALVLHVLPLGRDDAGMADVPLVPNDETAFKPRS